jgi:RNA polymerase sigma-32 factor
MYHSPCSNNKQFLGPRSPSALRLDREREHELALRWRDHADTSAANTLVLAAQSYVIATVRQYRRYRVPEADLIAEANFGVAQALRKFDPERGIRFITYAKHWIRASILEYIVRSWSIVGGGCGVLRTNMFFKIRRERALAERLLGAGEAADEEVAARLGLTPTALAEMKRRLDERDFFLDAPIGDGSGTWWDRFPSLDDQEQEVSYREVEGSISAAIERAKRLLDPRERYIAEQRLMTHPDDAPTLAEVGRQFGISRERARQIELRTVRKLRKNIAACADPIAREWIGHLTPTAT